MHDNWHSSTLTGYQSVGQAATAVPERLTDVVVAGETSPSSADGPGPVGVVEVVVGEGPIAWIVIPGRVIVEVTSICSVVGVQASLQHMETML